MIQFFVYLFCLFLPLLSKTQEITFELENGVTRKKELKYVALFPALDIFSQDLRKKGVIKEDASDTSIPFEADATSFDQWFSLAREIIAQKDKKLFLPEEYPLTLQKKIYQKLSNISFDEYQNFINVGDRLNVPPALMQCVCDFFSYKFFDKIDKNSVSHVQDIVTDKYFKNVQEKIKNMFMLSPTIFKVSSDKVFPIKRLLYIYVFSKKYSYVAYIHQHVTGNRFTVYYIDIASGDNKPLIQQHVPDDNAKNRKSLIRCAAQEPYLLTLCAYNDRILIHHIKDNTKNRFIQLNLNDGQTIACCDITSDGKHVIVGYSSSNPDDNMFVLYDEKGTAIHTISKKSPELCVCNPFDPTTSLLTAELNQEYRNGHIEQYIATLENNVVKMPFGKSEKFLDSESMCTRILYNGNGDYIFSLCYDEDSWKVYRVATKHLNDVDTYAMESVETAGYIPDLYVNDGGDCAIFSYHRRVSDHRLMLTNFLHKKVYRIPSETIKSWVLEGYLLIYLEQKDDKKELVFFNTLHQKEILRQLVSSDFQNLLGLTSDYKLIVKKRLEVRRDGDDRARYAYQIEILNIMNKECWELISSSLDDYSFLPDDVNFLRQLLQLWDAVKNSQIKDFASWIDNVMGLFSDEFRTLVMRCFDYDPVDRLKIKKAKLKIAEAKESYTEPLNQSGSIYQPLKDLAKKRASYTKKKTTKNVVGVATTTASPIPLRSTQTDLVEEKNVEDEAPSVPTSQQPAPQTFMQKLWSVVFAPVNWIADTIVTPLFRWFGFIQ